MQGSKKYKNKDFILGEAEKIFDYRHYITASFLSEKYDIDDAEFLMLVLSLSLILDEGHIRIFLDRIGDELEKYFILNIRQESPLKDMMLENCGKVHSIIGKYPEVFRDPSSLFRAPFIVLDSGKTVTSEKLFYLEKKAVELMRKFMKSSGDFPGSRIGSNEALSIACEVEEESGFSFESKQAEAVCKALQLPFLILTGGPGTGKTTTIISIVKALIRSSRRTGRKLSIALCAPTGRAANRIEEMLDREGLSGTVEKPQTLHRLLRLSSVSGRYENGRFLPFDAVITDESSMIDLRVMKSLFESLSPETSLVMAGDADQLPSVEAGAVFSDLINGADDERHILNNNIVVLDRMKRAGAGISDLASSIKDGSFSVSGISGKGDFLTLKPLDEKLLLRDLTELYFSRNGGSCVSDIIEKNGVLTTTNRGDFGMDSINRKIREAAGFRNVPYYEDMPVMVLKNDYKNMVFNGDRGIIVRKDDIYFAMFRTGSGDAKYIPLSMISDWTVSYAQTVHKSQGSEFENIYIVLDKFSERILTKEILYTAVTRAKKKIIIYSDEDTLITAMSRNIHRNSGIHDAMLRRL